MLRNLRALFSSLIFLSSLIHVTPLFAPPSLCEEIRVDRRQVMCRQEYDVSEIRKEFSTLLQRGYSATKAVGRIGELCARETIEEQTEYISIVTLFRKMGCHVENHIRDGADRGIDDIFVVAAANGTINRNFNPLFHEAKFSENCELRLASTKTICQQLSEEWLTHHVRGIQERMGASLCFDDKNEFVIQSCKTCKTAFLQDMRWIFKMLNAGRFHRSASVLCPDGKLAVYRVTSK